MEDQTFFDWGGIGDGTEIGLYLPSAEVDGDWSMESVDVATVPTWNGTVCDQAGMDLDGGGLLPAVQASRSGTNDHGPSAPFSSYLEDDGASSAQYSRSEADDSNAFSAPSSAPSYAFIEDPSSRPEADNNASYAPSYAFIEGPSSRPEADNTVPSSAPPGTAEFVGGHSPPPSGPKAYDQIIWVRPLQQDDTDEIISLGKSKLADKPVPAVKPYERNATPNAADGLYDCEYCEEKFPVAHAWKKHMDKHERPYKCTFEGCTNRDGFSKPCALMRHHEHLHLRKVQWFCIFEDCDRHERGFFRSDHARKHEERVHNYYRPARKESICRWCKRGEITGRRPSKRTTKKDPTAESPAEQQVIGGRGAGGAATSLEERIRYHKQELERLAGLLRGVPDDAQVMS
ncbi:hypothetical protein Z517_09406 [Fonsecaea pedrosoi CBS 271.37]|uniref:C2H2-type domain-containing protein n=1 Tax=Fonsecaea pedrosoi CBS 271.37 TaxID=1442368 RepID=A0A0D2ERU1_9EURO|nr:uncharacterized protein Z517_09406 [Fonsecaea pedrosoi CBS 271.37]KIW76962.1 hypothetical protein Z517_09406 [Fonsecaea pedrosoi CBS 271.37]